MGIPACRHTDPYNTHQHIPRPTQAQQRAKPQPPGYSPPTLDPIWNEKKNISVDKQTNLTGKINLL